jgi:hypothetical protein
MRERLRLVAQASALALGCAAFALGACGDDGEDDHGHSESDLTGDCKVISDACHHADEGQPDIGACHELAHENDTDACTAEKDACVELCEHAHE